MDKDLFRRRVLAALAEAEFKAPYEGVPNGVYLDRAWVKGAEVMAQTCLKVFDELEQSDQR